LIEAFVKAFPAIPQFACFDTAFHRDLPAVARMFPIPRRYYERGIHRFGFHGLSYTYLLSQLKKIAGEVAANGRVILAHLGAGASMAAVHRQKPIDTTMAFTPLAGLMMATRPGDLDPGLLLYLLRSEKPSADQLDDLLSNRSGLLGVSDTSSDMQTLLKSRATDSRAAEAVDLFCYQARKQLAALTATLGGLETVIFSGGIGEHAAEIRAGICEGLGYLGIHLDAVANDEGGGIISTKESRVMVRVIPTDEEVVIAESVASILQRASRRE
jgi:acetate kinase